MRTIDVGKIIDESKVNRFHLGVLFWCSFIIIFDGYDIVVYGSVVPILMEEWSITALQAGVIGSYTMFGIMFGMLFVSPVADKFGWKNVIIFCTALYSIFTGLVCFVNNPTMFGIYRFIAGIGMGGVVPVLIALTAEYSPKKVRSTFISIMTSGYCLGGVISAGIAIVLIPEFGWKVMFLVGALPVLSIPFLYKYLPDSPSFYLAKNQKDKISYLLKKVNPEFKSQEEDQYEIIVPKKSEIPMMRLFSDRRSLSTIMFWIASAMCLLMIYGLNTWLPKLMTEAGYALNSSLMFLLVLNFGAIIGTIVGGWISDRWSGRKVVIIFGIVGALSFILLGLGGNIYILYLLIALAGATTTGTQLTTYGYISQFYPPTMRSTGIGWTLGIGRIGGIAGPAVGGILISMSLPFQVNFLIFAIPGIIVALAYIFVQEKHSYSAINTEPKRNIPESTSVKS
ncbi:AAHS family benzoate transporter-like MFS transporter [Neobacillus niacini]|uniref:MFS transporter n=1 Tax=Neobacillus niacini TaxID=86668 RepID=UPI002789B21C|nr:aromatic acid/H+ symport family MFS transporter [Neobacillus niacini]MDQ1005302.1 AAHS family benzoate transporter-like MFS transporter [Neobacillus niacini]